MGINIKSEYNKFRIFMFAYWAMMLSVSGMYTMYIVEIGFSKMQISVAVTIFTISALIGQNFMGYLADRFRCVKKILFISISFGAATAAALMFSKQSWFINILIFIWGMFLYGTVPLSEAWFIEVLKSNGHQNEFGKIRGLGSIGYGFSGAFLGLLLNRFGWSIYVWYILISSCLVLLSILLMAENKKIEFCKAGSGHNEDSGNISLREALTQIIQIKPLRFILVILFMYNFVVKGIYIYLGVLVSDSGGGPFSLGLTYFFDASPEIISFFLASRLLRKYQSKTLIFAAFILQIVRLLLILVFSSPLSIILLGPMSGLAYGLLAAAYKTYIYELAPEKYKISCLSLSESIIAFSAVISAPVFGFAIIKFGTYVSIAMAVIISCAVASILAGNILKERYRHMKGALGTNNDANSSLE